LAKWIAAVAIAEFGLFFGEIERLFGLRGKHEAEGPVVSGIARGRVRALAFEAPLQTIDLGQQIPAGGDARLDLPGGKRQAADAKVRIPRITVQEERLVRFAEKRGLLTVRLGGPRVSDRARKHHVGRQVRLLP